ncbi:MAG: peptidase domain-containing ABC transporter, partial [Acidobacteriota bacterium]
MSHEELSRSFTGVALTFEPGRSFVPARREIFAVTRYVRPILARAGHLGRLVALSVILQGLALALPLCTAAVVDRVVPPGDRSLLVLLTCGAAGLSVYRFFCSLLRARLLLHLRTELDASLTLRFLDHLVNLPYAFFSARSGGDLFLRVGSNATIRETLTSSTLSALLDGALVSLYLVALFWTDSWLGLLVLGLGVFRSGIFLATRRRHRELAAESLQVQSAARSGLVEMLAGIETLKAAGAQNRAVKQWSDLFADELEVTVSRGKMQSWIDALLDSLAVASPLIVLLAGAQRVLDGSLSLGAMLAAGALAAGFLQPLSTLITRAFDLQGLAGTLERLNEVFDAPRERPATARALAAPLSGALEVRGVGFRYDSNLPEAVSGVSLSVASGELVAIVGPSGSGKSTLGALLFGLYPPSSGRIFFDGQDLGELDLDEVRSQLGIVTQNAYLFGTTIRANIALNRPEASLEEVIDAARKASIHEQIAALPMAYETVLADGGSSLSGGQRQRLAIARAIL